MLSQDWKEYLKDEKEKYKKLGYVGCPAFGNEKVYFNHYGFDHIVYKNGIPRPKEEVIKRFGFLKYAFGIIEKTQSIYSEERRMKAGLHAYFWTIKHAVYDKRIRIILRRVGDGTLHFFSIMDE